MTTWLDIERGHVLERLWWPEQSDLLLVLRVGKSEQGWLRLELLCLSGMGEGQTQGWSIPPHKQARDPLETMRVLRVA